MPRIVEINRADDPRDAIHLACQLIAEERLVGFPTETSYVVAAGSQYPNAVKSLHELTGGRIVLALKSPSEIHDYLNVVPPAAEKLSRRAWPGPLTMEFSAESFGGLFFQLREETRSLLVNSDRTIGLRVAFAESMLHVQRLCPAPLVLTADRGTLRPLPVTAQEVSARFGDRVALILDDGPCRYGVPTTTIRFSENQWKEVDSGAISSVNLDRLTSEIILFVCTGNTCRSPMAEALFRRRLAQRLQCTDDELMDRGFAVVSAGIAAYPGGPASGEAVATLAKEGIDLLSHESQQVTERLLLHADQIYTMTRSHLDVLTSEFPEYAHRVKMLSGNRRDISDPFGGGPRDYQSCKDEIEGHIQALVDQIVVSS